MCNDSQQNNSLYEWGVFLYHYMCKAKKPDKETMKSCLYKPGWLADASCSRKGPGSVFVVMM